MVSYFLYKAQLQSADEFMRDFVAYCVNGKRDLLKLLVQLEQQERATAAEQMMSLTTVPANGQMLAQSLLKRELVQMESEAESQQQQFVQPSTAAMAHCFSQVGLVSREDFISPSYARKNWMDVLEIEIEEWEAVALASAINSIARGDSLVSEDQGIYKVSSICFRV